MPSSSASILDAVHSWLHTAVIGLNLCPFAKPVVSAKRLRTVISEATEEDQLTRLFLEEIDHLLQTPDTELSTTLLVIPYLLHDFETYLDYLAFAEDIIDEVGLSGIFQLASFHPEYCFESLQPDDPANWTNRSPYPILHLLREAEISAILDAGAKTDAIPERNIRLLRSLPLEDFQRLFPFSSSRPKS